MQLNVGSKNPVKIDAVKELVRYYEFLRNPVVTGYESPSHVSSQPKSIDETVLGAINRANGVHNNGCDYSFGIEAGLMAVSHTKTGFMNITVCAIHDGTEYYVGFSSAFECPTAVTRMIVEQNMALDEAYYKAGLTQNKRVGYHEGIISDLTKGRLNRKEYVKEAVRTALIRLENHELY